MSKKNAGFAIAAVLGAALTTVSLSTGSASAMPSEGCDASQLTTTIVPGSPARASATPRSSSPRRTASTASSRAASR